MPLPTSDTPHAEPIPAGLHKAICYAIYDLGKQESKMYNKSSPKVLFIWELPDHRISLERDGQQVDLPRALSKTFGNTLSPRGHLRPALEAWRGKAFTTEELANFDLFNVLGAPCQLMITHNTSQDGRQFANIQSVLPWPTGETRPKQPENPLASFSFFDVADGADYTQALPNNTPDWVKERLAESEQARQAQEDDNGAAFAAEMAAGPEADEDDDCPF